MSISTDYLRLNEQKIIKNIRESLPKGIVKTLNLLTVKDDVLFVWNCQDNCVLTLNVKAARSREGDTVTYQRLLPPSPPCFAAEILVCNESCNLLAVAGPLGLLIMELPRRGPPNGSFSGNKEVIYCKSYSLDERLFAHSRVTELRQAKWHPASTSDNHLLLLTSDNFFRLYKVNRTQNAELVKIYQIGTQPMGILSTTRISFLAGLGETAVDFDFGSPEKPERSDSERWEDLNWPIYILRGDGELFTLIIDIYEKKKPLLQGPYYLHTSSDDKYTNDSCAILCFKTTPPVLALSTNTGTIYHCMLLTPNDDSEFGGKGKIVKHPTYTLHPAKKVLYVFETIELELGISVTNTESAYCCPIYLHPDDSVKGRYFCTHETGIHVVNVPIIAELEKFLEIDDDNVDMSLPAMNTKSSAEYLLCTHATGCTKVNPILGFSLFHCPTALIALLATGQVVTLPLISALLLPSSEQLSLLANDHISSPLKKMLNEPFDLYIRKHLQNDMNHPILQLNSENPDSATKNIYELLSRATQIFREDHFKRFDKIREELEKRVKALQLVKSDQLKEIERLNTEKQEMQKMAEKIAEKYEDIKDKQEELTKRCERLLISVTQKQPKPTEAENNLYKDLKQAEEKMKMYAKAMDQIKAKQKYQELQMTNWMNQQKKKDIYMGSQQTESIKTTLKDMAKQISMMADQVKVYKDELGLK